MTMNSINASQFKSARLAQFQEWMYNILYNIGTYEPHKNISAMKLFNKKKC